MIFGRRVATREGRGSVRRVFLTSPTFKRLTFELTCTLRRADFGLGSWARNWTAAKCQVERRVRRRMLRRDTIFCQEVAEHIDYYPERIHRNPPEQKKPTPFHSSLHCES